MPFKKGNNLNPNGRPKGAKGKRTQQWEALAETITGDQAEEFAKFMKELWRSKDFKKRTMAAELYIKTVEYFKPKQARVENHIEAEVGMRTIRFENATRKDGNTD